ncbi:MAG: exopolyphosphatase [Candidatus Adiutrix sp.]|jgi:exopolyphosphatase/guanosine-5'-triphosphate,3'-diphosphate pyrophosphatase|nr:exopolyphosphatase [Candidatus Adiutrix sp.]
MAPPPIAALDLGSNTFRLMLAGKAEEKRPHPWDDKRVFQELPRLAEGLAPGGPLAPSALNRAWEALDSFAAEIRASKAGRVLAGATMAARLAADGPAFLAETARRYGGETRLLTGEEEARLTAAGVLTGLAPSPPEALIFDIGGRSTEFITVTGGTPGRSLSLDLGVVGLTEAYLEAPARPGQLEAVALATRAALSAADLSFVQADPVLVGTAGTVTTMAALLLGLKTYDPDLVNNSRLARPALAGLLAELAPLSEARRVEKYGLHPRRADALPAGLALALEIMDHFRRTELTVSDNGLLEGLWLAAAGLGPDSTV